MAAASDPLTIPEAIARIVAASPLSEEESYQAISRIMEGEATQAQMASFLTAMKMKGETVHELVGAARAIRDHARRVAVSRRPVVDSCGTGGDGKGTFNISTVSAFVVAGCGVAVAKHGNRSVSSRRSPCGSADLLEALGLTLDFPPERAEQALEEVGITFLFAPVFHPSFRHVAGVRKELGVPTLFNLLGPLCNPASPDAQIIGVSRPQLLSLMAEVARELEIPSCFVVHGDGYDEAVCSRSLQILRVHEGRVTPFPVRCDELSLSSSPGDLRGGDARENARIALGILSGDSSVPRGARDVVILNSALLLLASGKVTEIREGVEAAGSAIDEGKAMEKLNALREYLRKPS